MREEEKRILVSNLIDADPNMSKILPLRGIPRSLLAPSENFGRETKLALFLYNENPKQIRFFLKEQISEIFPDQESKFKDYLQTFKEMVDRAIIRDKPTAGELEILRKTLLGKDVLRIVRTSDNYFYPEIFKASPRNVLWHWLYKVWRGEIKIKRCKTKDCKKIFIPKRSDQEYCSERCYDRQYKREKRALSRNNKIILKENLTRNTKTNIIRTERTEGKMGFAQAVKKYRKKHGLTQLQFARMVGVGLTSVSLWENGWMVPRQRAVRRRLEEILGDALKELAEVR